MKDIDPRASAFLHLRTRCWEGAKVLDPKAMEQIGDKEWLKGRKHLVDQTLLNPIRASLSMTRTRLALLTLPFPINSIYLTPKGIIEKVEKVLEEGKTEFWELVDEFEGKYNDGREKAKEKLGEHFRDSDYPIAIRGKFDFDWQYLHMVAPGEASLLDPAMYAREKERFTGLIEDAREMALLALRNEFQALVQHAADRLSEKGENGKPKIFRDSMLGKFEEFFSNFDARNELFDDKRLAELVSTAKKNLIGVTAGDLRTNDIMRDELGKAFVAIKKEVDDAVQDAPLRKIRRV